MSPTAVREDSATENVRARVPKDVYQTIVEMAQAGNTRISEVVSALLVRALLDSKPVGGAAPPTDVLEQAFCQVLAKTGDVSEVIQLQETAKFRGQTVMETVLNHVRYGIREGSLFE